MKKTVALSALFAWIIVIAVQCASAPKQESVNLGKFARSIQNNPTKLTLSKHYVLTDSADTESFVCAHPSSKRWAVLLNPDSRKFSKESVCTTDLLVQAFTQSDYNVIAVNAGQFFKDTALTQDFSGPETRLRIKRLLEQALSNLELKKFDLLWANGAASISAMFLTKDVNWFSKLIVGNGIFEIESMNKTLRPYAEVITQAENSAKNGAKPGESTSGDQFVEMRSIAWDASGLTNNVVIYHSQNNKVTGINTAKSFRDSLASEQFEVKFVPLEGADHLIDDSLHFSFIKALL